jgi:hypothetical protein
MKKREADPRQSLKIAKFFLRENRGEVKVTEGV